VATEGVLIVDDKFEANFKGILLDLDFDVAIPGH